MSIFPFIDASGVTDTKKVTDLPLLKEYAYDYAKNELLLDENGCTYLVEGNAALRIWIFKALTTARFRHKMILLFFFISLIFSFVCSSIVAVYFLKSLSISSDSPNVRLVPVVVGELK